MRTPMHWTERGRHFQAHPLHAMFSLIASMLLAALVVLALVLSAKWRWPLQCGVEGRLRLLDRGLLPLGFFWRSGFVILRWRSSGAAAHHCLGRQSGLCFYWY